ncbi:MAG: glycosyltransferase [bacterium]
MEVGLNMLLIFYQIFVTACIVIVLANALINLRALRKPPREGEIADPSPLISILVPVRNEERNIERCLNSLVVQDYPNIEILVLDDNSEDATSRIVEGFCERFPFVKLFRGDPLPPGWTGKNFACHQLAERARGSWLLFTDADTVHESNSVSSVYRAVRDGDVGFLSLIPFHFRGTLGEELFIPLIGFAFIGIFPLSLMNSVKDPMLSIALGPFMLIRRDVYDKVGGHKAIKGEIVDDIQLVRSVKRHGEKIAFMDGTDILSIRFYRSFRELWNGFSKNAFGAFDYSITVFFGFLALMSIIFIAPYIIFIKGLLAHHLYMAPAIQVTLITTLRFILAIRFRSNLLIPFLSPISFILGLILALNSARLILTVKKVSWKGREYSKDEGEVVDVHVR